MFFIKTPLVLQTYFYFSFITILIWVIQITFKLPFLEQIDPTWYTLFPLCYAFSIYFIYHLIFSTKPFLNKENLRLIIVGILTFNCLLSLFIIYSKLKDGRNSESIQILLFSISIMVIWISLFQLPSVLNYSRNNDYTNE
jgi:hypothetical protein